MQTYYADMHIHIGQTRAGHIIKIPSGKNLTFEWIAREALNAKGLHIVGIVDCASEHVLADIEYLVEKGVLRELPEGGLLYRDALLVVMGSEFELGGTQGGSAHFLAYFPTLKKMRKFSRLLSEHVTNVNLSCQRARGTPAQWLERVVSLEGLFIPAHAFTPYKSLFGNLAERLEDVFLPNQIPQIPALELGLSADTAMAETVPGLSEMTFLSNSDAHSLPKVAREYNVMHLDHLSYAEWEKALRRKNGRQVSANYGLDPRLGRFYRTLCKTCGTKITANGTITHCPHCGGHRIIKGVLDRIQEIGACAGHPPHRPVYHYQIPLEFVPTVGPKKLQRLIGYFGSEMAVLHQATEAEIARVVGPKTARLIALARDGKLSIEHGAGGRYGKVLLGDSQ